jgi:hypothetical protein
VGQHPPDFTIIRAIEEKTWPSRRWRAVREDASPKRQRSKRPFGCLRQAQTLSLSKGAQVDALSTDQDLTWIQMLDKKRND